MLPHIQVFALGGTIAMVPGASAGVRPSLTAEDLIAAVPGLEKSADISAATLAQVGSANLTVKIIADVCRKAEETACDGVVITQGTDTLEETAFLASLLYKGDKPLVFTGAMKTPDQPGADGPMNLYNAVILAASGQAPKVSVVMNGDIHDPWLMTKEHTTALDAFVSDFDGPLGSITDGHVQKLRTIPCRPQILKGVTSLAPVALLSVGLEMDEHLLLAVMTSGYKGLVVEAFGAGHVSEPWSDILAEIAQGIPVLLATRARGGPVLEATYGYKGAEIDLINRGLIPCGRLKGRKARLLLALLLALGVSDWRSLLIQAIKSV